MKEKVFGGVLRHPPIARDRQNAHFENVHSKTGTKKQRKSRKIAKKEEKGEQKPQFSKSAQVHILKWSAQ